jgi:AcrR family transcriptional regulator
MPPRAKPASKRSSAPRPKPAPAPAPATKPAAPPLRTAAEVFGAPPPRDTRERILHVALDLFYTHGFHEVGLDRVLAATRVTKTTFYNHFESRDQLILEALALRDAWEQAACERQMRAKAGYDPRALLLAAFDVLDDWFNLPEYQGCLFMAACAEYPAPWHPIHKRAAASFKASEDFACGLAKAAGARDPADLARTWVLLLQGALGDRLISGAGDGARRARAVFERLLDAEVPRRAAAQPG